MPVSAWQVLSFLRRLTILLLDVVASGRIGPLLSWMYYCYASPRS